jgi:hypothetical protein
MKLKIKDLERVLDEVVVPFCNEVNLQNEQNREYIKLLLELSFYFLDGQTKNLKELIDFYKKHNFSYEEVVVDLTKFFLLLKKWLKNNKLVSKEEFNHISKVYEELFQQEYEEEKEDFFFFDSSVEDFDKVQNNSKKISASEFFEEYEIDEDTIERIDEIKENLEMMIIKFDKDEFKNILAKLIALLDFYLSSSEMKDMAKAFNRLYEYLNEKDVNEELLISVIEDIINWIEHIFIYQDAIDIHYLDAAFFANISQLEIMRGGGELFDKND